MILSSKTKSYNHRVEKVLAICQEESDVSNSDEVSPIIKLTIPYRMELIRRTNQTRKAVDALRKEKRAYLEASKQTRTQTSMSLVC
jgi:hypothetical protein